MTETNTQGRSLVAGFLESAERFADRPALSVDGRELTYAELQIAAATLAATLQAHLPHADPPLTAVFAERSTTAYAGVLAALLRGHGYVPLSPRLPATRTRAMIQQAGLQAVIADSTGEEGLAEALVGLDRTLVVLLPERDDVAPWAARLPRHTVLGRRDLAAASAWRSAPVAESDIAYLLFTSGSTGVPKGVMVAHRNVNHFLDFVVRRYALTCDDRFSQTFDLVFDLSVFDLFAAWQVGGCVCVPSRRELLTPGTYIDRERLSVWFSVPSLGLMMKRLRLLPPGAYPRLRWCLFCGEALTVELAATWAAAAAAATIENLYGPTELTLACTLYRWDPITSPAESHQGIVPIGYPFDGSRVLIVDEALRPVPPLESGELLVAGPQVALGYYRDPGRTAESFVVPPGERETYYRTGDRVVRHRAEGPLLYLGRMDHQLKIRGNRIELGEIEAALREVSGVSHVAAIGWPVTPAGADGVIAFLAAEGIEVAPLREALAARLPDYAVPRELRLVAALPLNPNGKVDRPALAALCERSAAL